MNDLEPASPPVPAHSQLPTDHALSRYEEKYMSGSTGVLASSKMKAGRRYHGAWAVVLAVLLLNSTSVLQVVFACGLVIFAWLFFSVLRVTVTGDHVHVQYGLFGPKIPMRSIVSVEPIAYDWTRYGGWGIRRRWLGGETIYNMPGDGGRAVRIRWVKRGRQRATVVGTANHVELAELIRRAHAQVAAPLQAAPMRELDSAGER